MKLLVSIILVCGFAIASVCQPIGASANSATPGNWKAHKVYQLNGPKLPSNHQIMTESWNGIAAVPYIAYMPEKNRVYMVFLGDMPHHSKTMYSDDWGATWSEPRNDATGIALTNLGKGKLITVSGSNLIRSNDFGETWGGPEPNPPASNGKPWICWDPMLVDKDADGNVLRLMSYCTDNQLPNGHFQGYVRFSTDEGQTWSEDIKVPEMYAVNEVAFVRARNGDIIAACRTDNPDKFALEVDHYGGLGVCISKDNGYTWSKMNMLYEWGRHHPSMVLLPNGDVVMTYVVRRGYPDSPDGYPQFGIEAVVSNDSGKSWDLDHKYILSSWKGLIKGDWYNSSQATSTVLLPNGSLLTAFGTGYRGRMSQTEVFTPRDIGLINWRVNSGKLKPASAIAKSPIDSDKRNKFDLNAFFGRKMAVARGPQNIATVAMKAQVTSSHAIGITDPNIILYNPYYYRSMYNLDTTPAWVEISWPKAHKINEIVIYPGQLGPVPPSTELTIVDYQLQYKVGNDWHDLVPPVTNAQRYTDLLKDNPTASGEDYKFVHKFAPVSVQSVRLLITRTSDSGKRRSSPDKVIVPEDKRECIIRGIDVFEAK